MAELKKIKKKKYNSSFFLNSTILGNNTSNSLKNVQIMEELSKTHAKEKFGDEVKISNISKLFKNMFTNEAGKTINNLKMTNRHMKSNTEMEKFLIKSGEMNPNNNINNINNIEPFNINSMNVSMSNSKKENTTFNNQNVQNISMKSIFNKSPYKTHSLPELKINLSNNRSQVIANSVTNNQFYCPCCTHCNKMSEETLESQIFSIKEAKNVLTRAVEYAVSQNLMLKTNLDIFNVSQSEGILKDTQNNNDKDNNSNDVFDFDKFNSNFPKQIVSNNRSTYQIVAYFLNALLEDKLSLSYLANPDLIQKLEKLFLPRGVAFEKTNNEEVIFDEELEKLFDGKTKEIIKTLFRKKYLTNLSEIKKENDKSSYDHRKKFLILFLVFIQVLAEISVECKEKAVLLYRFFKLYFAEQEKKWIIVVNKMKEKVKYYRDLCKTVIHQKNKHLDKIESINDVLFSNKLDDENLKDHKKLIQDLLKIINEKREEIYLMKAENEILVGELKTMVYDYDTIKLNKKMREQFLNFPNEQVAKNVNDEMKHKNLPQDIRSLLVNADRYLIISGQRNYFYDQKQYYLSEIERLSNIYQKAYFKKREYKKQTKELEGEVEKVKDSMQKEILFLRSKISVDKNEIGINTEVDIFEYNKMRKNHDLVYVQKRLTTNKLNEFIERIQYGCSKNKPISMKSLMSLIPDLYNEKIDSDSHAEMDGSKKLFLDDFLFRYISQKFKLKRIIKKNTEEIIMAVMKYCKEDNRIDLLRRFLGIGEDKIRREVLDMYLTFLKNLPISFFKIFDEEHNSYLMNIELCFEIYHTRYPQFNLVSENRSSILKNAMCIDAQTNEIKKLKDEKKLDFFLINRFYNKSYILITDLLNEFKNNQNNESDLKEVADQFANINKEFKYSPLQILDLLKRNFAINTKTNKISLESFFNFFAVNKMHFKIKIMDFLDISLNSLVSIFGVLEKRIMRMYEEADFRKIGLIYYKEFEEIVTKIMGGFDNKWKVGEYFKVACGSQDKEFLSKEEFVIFVLNTKEIISVLISTIHRD